MFVDVGCYGRVAPRSGLAWKHSIDVGAGGYRATSLKLTVCEVGSEYVMGGACV